MDSYSRELRLALEAIIKSTLAKAALYVADNSAQAALAQVVYELISHPDLNRMWVRRITGISDPFPIEEKGQDPLIGAWLTHLEVRGGTETLYAGMAIDEFLLFLRDPGIEGNLHELTRPWATHINYFGLSDNIKAFGEQWDGVDAIFVWLDACVVWIWRVSFP